jgi:hypothetical protein
VPIDPAVEVILRLDEVACQVLLHIDWPIDAGIAGVRWGRAVFGHRKASIAPDWLARLSTIASWTATSAPAQARLASASVKPRVAKTSAVPTHLRTVSPFRSAISNVPQSLTSTTHRGGDGGCRASITERAARRVSRVALRS